MVGMMLQQIVIERNWRELFHTLLIHHAYELRHAYICILHIAWLFTFRPPSQSKLNHIIINLILGNPPQILSLLFLIYDHAK